MRKVSKISAKNDKPIEDLLGILDLGKIDEIKQSTGVYASVEDVLRKYKGFMRVLWRDKVASYFEKCYSNAIVAIDTETDNSVDPRSAILVGLCLYTPYSRPVYIPVNHRDKYTKERIKNQITEEELKPYLEKFKSCFCIYHNAKFDVNVILTNTGVRLPIHWDTQIAAKVLDENLLNAKLKELYRLYIEPAQPLYKIDNLFKENITAKVDDFAIYSAMDPYETFQLYVMQNKILSAPTLQKLRKLFEDVEMKVTNICAEMEQEGAYFDKELASIYLKKFKHLASEKLKVLLDYFEPLRGTDKITEWPINFNSPDQTVSALNAMGISCEDSKEPTLSALSKVYPICQVILDYRSNDHMVTAFFDPLLKMVHPKTGRIHSNFNQLGDEDKTIKTGRFSSSKPNLQQLPSFDDSVRLCFCGGHEDEVVKTKSTAIEVDSVDLVETTSGFVVARFLRESDLIVDSETGEVCSIQKIIREGDLCKILLEKSEQSSIPIKIRHQNDIVGSDYSAQEPRLTASISNEQSIIDGYNLRSEEFPRGKDYYSQLASAAFNKPYWECTEFRRDGSFNEEGKKIRSRAKGLQLAITYGMGPAHLSNSLEVDIQEAKKILSDFFSSYRNIKIWKDFNTDKMKAYGFMETILGRRRRLPDVYLKPIEVTAYDTVEVDNIFPHITANYIKVKNQKTSEELTENISKMHYKKKEKMKEVYKEMGYDVKDNGAFISRTNTQCTNSVIQGSAADMTKLAMIEIFEDKFLRDRGVRLRFLVHDEILIECPVKYRKEVEKEFVDCMIRVARNLCKVHMICDAELETRWKQGHTVGKIQKCYKSEGLEGVYNNYIEFNREDLKNVCNNEFDVEQEILRINEEIL